MSLLFFIEYPKPIPVRSYKDLKNKIIGMLTSNPDVKSIYQIGSVKSPGISDLDLVCVFKDGSTFFSDLRSALSAGEKSILTHGIFGIEAQDFLQAIKFNHLSNLTHLSGEDLLCGTDVKALSISVQRQIAIEYLLKIFITLDVQINLGVIKVRSFLLLAKAVEFDLELLGIGNGHLYDLVEQVIQLRSSWFDNTPDMAEFETLVLCFHKRIKELIEQELDAGGFCLPEENFVLPGNFFLEKSDHLSVTRKGIKLPAFLCVFGKKFINLQYKLNRFHFTVPFEIPAPRTENARRFQYCKKVVEKNRKQLPGFLPLTSSLSIF